LVTQADKRLRQASGDASFLFLARSINSQPSTIQKLREYKAVYVQSDAEIGLFSDEVVVNCAP
jgi:hypothetical protein